LTHELIVRPEAERDLRAAHDWYDEQVRGLGEEFLRSIDAVFASMRRHPEAFPIMHEDVRRALVRRFPYAVFYVVENDRIAVLAVLHMRQDPSDWPAG
jgi:plasmid stabilization system protein ParE